MSGPWPVLAIFGLALALRLIHLWQLSAAPFFDLLIGDARAYDLWAQQIAAGDWVGQGVFYQAPLYAYFLGVVYTIAGHHLIVVRLMQAVMGSLACVLIAAAGTRLYSRPAGLAAGLMLAVYAPAIFFDGLIQKAALDVPILAVMLWILARWLIDRRDAVAPWGWLGAGAGLLSLSRENALVFVVVLAGWALVRGGRVTRANLARAAVLVGGIAVVLLPVALRNYAAGGELYVTTSQFGPNFYIGNHPDATGSYEPLRAGRGGAQYEREDATELAEQALGRPLSPAEVSRYWTGRALAFIRGEPKAWLALMATKAALLVNATEIMDTDSQDAYADWSAPLSATAWFAHFGVLVPLAVVGIVLTWRERRAARILVVMTVAYGASVVLFYVFARYRYPLVPFLILFAAAGAAALPRFFRTAPRPVAWTTLTAAVVMAVFTNQRLVDANLTRAVMASNLGQALWADGRRAEAIAEYRRAIALNPDWAGGHFSLGNALRETGHAEEAIAEFQRALALDPGHDRARYSLGAALLSLGRSREALVQLRAAAAALPDSSDAERALGIALSREGYADEALAAFERALQLAPESAEAQNDLGVALAGDGRFAEAAARFERALALKPDFAEAQRNLEAARRLGEQKK